MASKLSFAQRAELAEEHPLKSYLLHLISVKKTNLCVSADVNSTSALLRLAEDVGEYICVLKTHADIVDDWGIRTVKGLREIAQRKKFLLFEDRKFGDIGSTVRQQYTHGHYKIASWAHIVNAHAFPGPDIVAALKAGADEAIKTLKQSVETEIFVGTPTISDNGEDDSSSSEGEDDKIPRVVRQNASRPGSVVTTTTIFQTIEQPGGARVPLQSPGSPPLVDPDLEEALATLHDPPFARGLLLFAQMSSRNNMMDQKYTEACVKIAKEHPDFVMGYISQQSLNDESTNDNFISMTPGVKMAPEGEETNGSSKGDDLGQQYRTPEIVIKDNGCDIIIVGRGIIGSRNRKKEAERYRLAAWKAYETRLGPTATRFR